MRPTISFVYLFLGAVIFSIPNMTRRGILFAVPVPPNFRQSAMGRRSVTIFRALVAAATVAGLCGLLFSLESSIAPVAIAEPLLILFAGGIGFVWQNRRLTRFAVQPSQRREADLSGAPDQIPWFTWLGTGPFAIIAIAAAFLRSNWESIPMRFPVHWGVNGQPNRWTERNLHGVYGPLLFAAELCAWLLIMALAGWFGARRSRFRRMMLGAAISAEYLVGLLFVTISITPLVNIPIWVVIMGPMVFIVPMMIVMGRKIAEPGDAVERTPNECWKAGVIYYNPDDAALMVEKRTGLGYTLNFGNRWSWALIFSLGIVLASAFVLL